MGFSTRSKPLQSQSRGPNPGFLHRGRDGGGVLAGGAILLLLRDGGGEEVGHNDVEEQDGEETSAD